MSVGQWQRREIQLLLLILLHCLYFLSQLFSMMLAPFQALNFTGMGDPMGVYDPYDTGDLIHPGRAWLQDFVSRIPNLVYFAHRATCIDLEGTRLVDRMAR